jgi:ribosomal protein L11 methyltransferase
MKRAPLWQISTLTTPPNEEAVAELLSVCLGQPASSYTDLKTGKTTVTVYLSTKPSLTKSAEETLGMALKRLPGRTRVRLKITRLKDQDWANSWRRHFKPLEIGKTLLIQPGWSRRRPKPGQAVVTLDPGMTFGTGQHPTTAFCLSELVRLRNPKRNQSVLDVGTGSGILSISAAKLGYGPIHALDVDPLSVKIARANARQNGVGATIQFACQDFSRTPRRSAKRHSVVCANLIATLLLSETERLLGHLEEGGQLVVAGILKEEFSTIRAAFTKFGLRLDHSRVQGEWRSGSFRRNPGSAGVSPASSSLMENKP